MDLLKTIFPFSFKNTKENNGLVISIILYVVAAAVVCLACWLVSVVLAWIPVLGFVVKLVLGIVQTVVGTYAVIGIVLTVLNRFGVIS